jgi:hypothetical protein
MRRRRDAGAPRKGQRSILEISYPCASVICFAGHSLGTGFTHRARSSRAPRHPPFSPMMKSFSKPWKSVVPIERNQLAPALLK